MHIWISHTLKIKKTRLDWVGILAQLDFPDMKKIKKEEEEDEDYTGLLFRPAWSLCIGTGLYELSTSFGQLK